MISISNLSKEFAEKQLFKNLNLTIYDGERVGIVGNNGTGKSSFLNIIAGIILPSTGSVKVNGTIAYVEQANLNHEFNLTNNQILQCAKLLKKFNLHFSVENLILNFNRLSGGEKTKFLLATALAKQPDVLLLDEPTNNLDEKSVSVLIDEINNFKGTLIVVSHDRWFLNKTVYKIIELENGNVIEFCGNYDDYFEQKTQQLAFEKKQYFQQQIQNKKIEEQIAYLKQKTTAIEGKAKRDGSADSRAKGYKTSVQAKATKLARSAQAKSTRLAQQKNHAIEKPFENRQIFYKINHKSTNSKLLLKFTNVKKQFGNNLLFQNVNFEMCEGEKIAIIGDNGSGKTTLVNMILGNENLDGEIFKSSLLKIACLNQNSFTFCQNQTIFDLAGEFDAEYKTKFLTNLANMGFNRQIFNKDVCKMSFGERLKIRLNQLILTDFNMLILDEPTNNMDIANKIFLEQVLKEYKGNLMLICHDKTFVDNTCNSRLIIQNKTITKMY